MDIEFTSVNIVDKKRNDKYTIRDIKVKAELSLINRFVDVRLKQYIFSTRAKQ